MTEDFTLTNETKTVSLYVFNECGLSGLSAQYIRLSSKIPCTLMSGSEKGEMISQEDFESIAIAAYPDLKAITKTWYLHKDANVEKITDWMDGVAVVFSVDKIYFDINISGVEVEDIQEAIEEKGLLIALDAK